MDGDAIDALVANIELDDGTDDEGIEDWGSIADESRNQDTIKPKNDIENEVNVEEAIKKTELQRSGIEKFRP